MEASPLEEIESSPRLKLLMEDWHAQADGLRQQVQHKETLIRRCQTEAFLFFAFHVLFQGSILACVLSFHSQTLICSSLWAPVSISLLSALPLALAISTKLSDSENLQIQLREERSILRDLHESIQQLRVRGKKFKLRSYGSIPYCSRLAKKRAGFRVSSICVALGASVLVLFAFVAVTALVLVSCARALCYHGV
jgi:hypothetical protein